LNTDAPLIFLSYGRVSDSSAARVNEGRLIAARGGGLGRQVALIGARSPAFRLNSPGWLAVAPELAAALDSRSMLRMLCRDRLLAAVPPFAAQTRRIVEAYLDRVEEIAGPPPQRAEAVTDPSDRYFSALLPLPNAQIQIVTADEDGLQANHGQDPARADLAFWDGTRLTAILTGGAGARLPRQARALEALELAAGGRVIVHQAGASTDFDLDTILPEAVLKAMAQAREPFYGPYRAGEFLAELPNC
jgi:hypothetical protein